MIAMISSGVAGAGQACDVIIQAAASAATSDAIAATLVGFLNEEAEQLGCIIDAGKTAGLINPEIDTTALALPCQTIGIGTHLMLAAGLDNSHIPATHKWDALLAGLIGSITTAKLGPSPHPDV